MGVPASDLVERHVGQRRPQQCLPQQGDCQRPPSKDISASYQCQSRTT